MLIYLVVVSMVTIMFGSQSQDETLDSPFHIIFS